MPDERDDIEMMLPWYVSGKLDNADRKRVEAFLASDPAMAKQLALIREERDAAVDANEAAGAPGGEALDRLMTSIEAEPARTAVDTPAALWEWASRLVGAPVPAGLRWVAAAAVVVIAIQAVALGLLATSGVMPGTRYQTATGEAQSPAKGTFALIRFADKASAAEIAALLSDMDAVIVDGPKPDGIFKIRLSSSELAGAERDALLKKLLSNQTLVTYAVAAGSS